MYDVNTYTLPGDNFIAGGRVEKEALAVATGETIQARSLIKLVDGEAKAYAAADLGGEDSEAVVPYGIAAADAEGGQVVVYMTGEFFASKLTLPNGVSADDVKPLLRSNGIFLKDLIE